MIATLAEAAVTMSQSVELSILVKATAIAAAGLLAVRLQSRARASVRHLLLAITFASLVALPLLLVAGPLGRIDVPVAYSRAAVATPAPARPADTNRAGAAAAPIAASESPSVSTMTIARTAWLAGAVAFLAPVPIVLWRLRRIRRTGLPWTEVRAQVQSLAHDRGISRHVDLVRHEHVAGPITFGVTRPVIVLPADANEWPEADLRRAIVHELEHIQRCDWIVLLTARSICACYWFHPLAWMAWRQLSLEAERSCDDAVVLIEERTDYAEQLVTLAQRLSATQEAPMLGMANRSDLSTRVTAVLDDRQRRGRAGLGLVAGVVAAASLVVIGVAPLTAVARVEAREAVVAAPKTDNAQGPQDAADREALIKKLEEARASNQAERIAEVRKALEEIQVRTKLRRVKATRTRALDRALYEAANEGDLEQVNEILAAGANANAVIYGDGSPLIAAARDGNMTIVRRLVDAGADPNLPVEGDGSPLIQAAAAGHLEVVRYLIDNGADVNLAVAGDENPLMCAAEQGHLRVVQYLVDRGANVNERIWTESSGRGGREGEWRTAISQATKNRHTAVVQYLMSVGARE